MTAYDWRDRVVLVTGGTRCIGLETALGFARAGALGKQRTDAAHV